MAAASFGLSPYNLIIPGILSSVASLAVCVTTLVFPELRNLRYIELVCYVSVNELLASIGAAIGPTQNGSFACWFQGITTNANYLSATLWATLITYQIWLVVYRQTVIKDLTFAHIICWGIPLLVSLLPLSTSTYSNIPFLFCTHGSE